VAMLANAASLKNTMRITVLGSETRSLSLHDNGVPTNCDQLTFDGILPFHNDRATGEYLAGAG